MELQGRRWRLIGCVDVKDVMVEGEFAFAVAAVAVEPALVAVVHFVEELMEVVTRWIHLYYGGLLMWVLDLGNLDT